MNPIENIWGNMKKTLASQCLNRLSADRLWSAVKSEWERLQYVSSGALMQDSALSFRVGISTAHEAVQETCSALWSKLKPMYMPTPTTATWLQIAEAYCRTWQFPKCIGAVDGKHVQIKFPRNSGSMYFNYRGTYSIVLLAVIDVGAYGKQTDGGVLEQSKCAEDDDAYRGPGFADSVDGFGQRRSGQWRDLRAQPSMQLEEAARSHDDLKPTSSRLSTSAQAVVYVVSHPNFPFCQSLE
ncbi:hypothetical protein HPB52_013088 [Rhipicephalus sanguineus]|uniref:DDE Tnp4 domain-containing protein n=1 Tax=Rhipicephalus sanguineus TaxID=34632 RepID=A0A9D4SYG1_RHISA|nr:hypothetical protein HPB52_013088 [Rhipicephalus sanguineus]